MNEFTRKALALADEMVTAKAIENHANQFGSLARWKEWGEKYEAARAALLAHLEGGEQKWLPIETAPKEVKCLLWSARFERLSVDLWGDYDIHNQPKFTHWQPLPATPTEESP